MRWFFLSVHFVGNSVLATARSETLDEALHAAFINNPLLLAQREKLKAAGEDVVAVRSTYFPKVAASAQVFSGVQPQGDFMRAQQGQGGWSYAVTLDQPLFDGFKTANAVSESQANELASRQDLRLAEQATLLEAATSYVDLIRDRSILHLRTADLDRITEELKAARTRKQNGDATDTDIAISSARLARSKAALAIAKASTATTDGNFTRIVGHRPAKLQKPGLPAGVPAQRKEAESVSAHEIPAVIAALHHWEAAHYASDKVAGDLWPQVSLRAEYGRTVYFANQGPGSTDDSTIGARIVVPLIDGGEVRARWRQAKHIEESRRLEFLDTQQRARTNAVGVWERYRAAVQQEKAGRAAVTATRRALSGIVEERRLGQKSTIDVLNAAQELVEAQVLLAQAEHDKVQTAYALLDAIGRLSLADSDRRGPAAAGSTDVVMWRTTVSKGQRRF